VAAAVFCFCNGAGEAQLLMQLLSGLLAAGVPGSDIGIISPYKAQVCA
jgi:superfamily I DNA and/or RNA helicase